MPTENSKTENEAQIRELIENRIKAVRAKDINEVMSNYASDVLSFDVVNPLQYLGSDAVRKRLEEWFSSFQGPMATRFAT